MSPLVPIAQGRNSAENFVTVAIFHSPRQFQGRDGRQIQTLIVGLGSFLLPGCIGAEAGAADAATYHCENRIFFSAEFFGRSARVTTLRNTYLLERRPSSIGRKYSDGDVFFIQDEDRAVLVGAADGPYRRCAER